MSVLHLGCVGDSLSKGPDSNLHVQISKVSNVLWGVDINFQGIEELKRWLPEDNEGRIHYLCGDAENLQNLKIERHFQLVLAGSTIEHLANPGLMLAGAKAFCEKEGEIIITPHSFGLLQFLRVAFRRLESVNPEHTCWFSFSTLNKLCSRYNLTPVEWLTGYGYKQPGLKGILKRAIGVPFFRLFPHLGGSLMVVLKPLNENTYK